MGKEENHLFFGGLDVAELAEKYGTPLYITDERQVRKNFRAYKEAFRNTDAEVDIDIYYAVKANGNLAILRILADEGAGADVFSDGELYLARVAGIPAEKILFNGNSKSEEELREALKANVEVSVDSLDELRTLSRVAEEMGKEVEIAIRVNPDISPDVHPKIATGLRESKFGILHQEVIPACREVKKMKNVSLGGIHCHIGSQILDVSAFSEATKKMVDIASKLYENNVSLKFIDLGGGLGIGYRKEEKEKAPTPKDLAKAILPVFEERKKSLGNIEKLILEPGRSIVGATTILLSKVNAVKKAYKNFVAIDAGFNLLIRPVMYEAYHEVIVANKIKDGSSELYTIVGPICEAGDIIAKERMLPKVEKGDFIAILDSGAYCFSMSSQYNGRARCAEMLVNNGKVDVIRSKEGVEDLIKHQTVPARLL